MHSAFGVYTACTVEDWSSILLLADRWNFESIKALAILKLAPIASPIDKIVLGRRHGVNDWLKSAYTAVCLQEAPLNLQEGRRLGVDDVIRINAVRYYHVPDRRLVTIPLSDTHIDDTFELFVEKRHSAPDEPTAENAVKSGLQDEQVPAAVETLADGRAAASADARKKAKKEEEEREQSDRDRAAREIEELVVQRLADEAKAAEEAAAHQGGEMIPGGWGSGGDGWGAPGGEETAGETAGDGGWSEDGGWPEDNTDTNDMRIGALDIHQLAKATSAGEAEKQASGDATRLGGADPLVAGDGGRATAEIPVDFDPLNDLAWDCLPLGERKKKQIEAKMRIERAQREEVVDIMAEQDAKLNAVIGGPGDDLTVMTASSSAPSFAPAKKEEQEIAQVAPKKVKKGGGKKRKSTALSTPITPVQPLGAIQSANTGEETSLAYRPAKIAAEGMDPHAKHWQKVDENVKELFSARNLDNAENYLLQLTPVHHSHFAERLVNTAIQSKAAEDVQLVADLFARAVQKGLCSQASFEEGFVQSVIILNNIAIEASKLIDLMAVMMKGVGFDKDARERIACKSMYRYRLLDCTSACWLFKF